MKKIIGKILMKSGMIISAKVPTTMGMIGTGLIRAGKATIDKTEVDLNDLVNMMESFIQGIMERGKGSLRRTIIDSLHPAVEA
ncbi:MAG: DAK2 domain-containing protein [Actinomycetota bacterium]|nr:DAK2 domain-containing protein [Actinomycetota bacterium]